MDLSYGIYLLALIALIIIGIICIGLICVIYSLVRPSKKQTYLNNEKGNEAAKPNNNISEDKSLNTSLTLWGLGLTVMLFAVEDISQNRLWFIVPGIWFLFVGFFPRQGKFIEGHRWILWSITAIVVISFFFLHYFVG